MNGPFTECGQGSEKPTGNGESQGKQQPEALPPLGQKQCGHWNSGEGWLQQSGCPHDKKEYTLTLTACLLGPGTVLNTLTRLSHVYGVSIAIRPIRQVGRLGPRCPLTL